MIKNILLRHKIKSDLELMRLQNLKRAYEGGKVSDFYPILSGASNSPNQNMQVAGIRMRERARNFDENHDIITGLFDTLVNNIVGNTNPIRPLVRNTDGSLNTETNTQLLRKWREFSVKPTLCGPYSMLQSLKLSCRSWLRDGECLTRIVKGNVAGRDNFPLAIEMIEADFLPYDLSNDYGKNTIIQGVELDSSNRVIAFHFLKKNPDNFYLGYETNRDDTKRVLAPEVLHLKLTRRTHQVRGVTILHSVMNRIADLKDYEESERIAARVAAAMTGFVQKSGETLGATSATGDRTFEMSPGMIFDNLLPGETINTLASNRPNPELINFRSAMLRAIAAGTGSNYSSISRDYSGTFSSQRQELLESKPLYESRRQEFVDMQVHPIWREFISMLQLRGEIQTQGLEIATINDIEIRGIDIGWIDPKKQADATETSIRSGITTRSKVIRDSGGDPAAVFAEWSEEQELFGDLEEPETTTGKDDEEEQEQN